MDAAAADQARQSLHAAGMHHHRAGDRHDSELLFDGVVDFDAATLDPATGNMKAAYLPNSQFTQLPWDYLHPNHAGYNAMGLAIDIAPFAPRRHHHH